MDYDFQSSVAFSPNLADQLNHKVSRLSPLLYVFCYYSPRSYREDVSASVNFWTAVINTQALFNDCFPQKRDSLITTFFPTDDLYNQYRNFKEFINWLRGMYCHNNSIIDGEDFWKRNRRKYCQNKGLKIIQDQNLSDDDFDVFDSFPMDFTLADKVMGKEEDWLQATKIVCILADCICKMIENSLTDMISTKDSDTVKVLLNGIYSWTIKQYMRISEYFRIVAQECIVFESMCSQVVEALSKWTSLDSRNTLVSVAKEMVENSSFESNTILYPKELLDQIIRKCNIIEINNIDQTSYAIEIEKK